MRSVKLEQSTLKTFLSLLSRDYQNGFVSEILSAYDSAVSDANFLHTLADLCAVWKAQQFESVDLVGVFLAAETQLKKTLVAILLWHLSQIIRDDYVAKCKNNYKFWSIAIARKICDELNVIENNAFLMSTDN